MLRQLTARQLAEWEEYSKLEPIGQYKHNYEFAYLMSHITNLFISAFSKKGAEMTKPEDYMINWGGEVQETEKQSVTTMKSVLMSWAKSRKGKEKVNNFKRATK